MQRARGDHVRVEQRGPDSNLTLHYLWLCSYYAMKVMVEKVSSNLPPGKVNSSGEAPAAGARVGAGRFLAPLRGKLHFFATFWRKCKNPLPRESNRRPPLVLHRGLSVRPDPQVFTRGECNNKGGPESFQISDVSCVLSTLNTLHTGHRLLLATLPGLLRGWRGRCAG